MKRRIEVTRERHDAPPEVVRRLALAGGTNPYGDPIYRVVWGWDRLAWIGGRWEEADIHGNSRGEAFQMREEPKYFAAEADGRMTFNRWFVEKWQPATAYGPPSYWYAMTEEWENQTLNQDGTTTRSGRCLHTLGPFPSRGDWEHCFTLETNDRKFLGLEVDVVDVLVRLIELSRLEPRSRRLAALHRREEKKVEKQMERNLEILSDVSPFMKGSHVSYAGMDARPQT